MLQSSDQQKYALFIDTFDKSEIFPFNHLYLANPCSQLRHVVHFCKKRCSTIKDLHAWINSYRDMNGLQDFENVSYLEISPRLLLRRDNEDSLPEDFKMESVRILHINENLMSISVTETLIDRFPNLHKVILSFDPHIDSISAFQVLLPKLKQLVDNRRNIQFVFNDLNHAEKINRNGDKLLQFFIVNSVPNLIVHRLWLRLPSLSFNLLPMMLDKQKDLRILSIHAENLLSRHFIEIVGNLCRKLEVFRAKSIVSWDCETFLDALNSCRKLKVI